VNGTRTWQKDVRALVFLATRSMVNGVKRAVLSPKRMLGVVLFGGYCVFMLRTLFTGGRSEAPAVSRDVFKGFPFPPIEVVQAVTLAIFLFVFLLFTAQCFSPSVTYRKADVDTLFPTPISVKIVIVFRIIRDALVQLLVPLFFAILLLQANDRSLAMIFRNLPNPTGADSVLRTSMIAYFLLGICLTTFAYGVSLVLNRPIPRARWMHRLAVGLYFLIFVGLGAGLYVSFLGQGAAGLVELSQQTWLRMALFPATAAAEFALAPLTTHWGAGLLGLAVVLGVGVFGFQLAMAQSSWFYDIASLRAHSTTQARSFQQNADYMGAVASRARSGKARFARASWLMRWSPRKMGGLLWKEALLAIRTATMTLLFTGLLGVLIGWMGGLVSQSAPRSEGVVPILALCFVAFISATNVSQTGFLETLRRIDLLKPLPFAAWQTVFAEVAGKSLVSLIPVLAATVAMISLVPTMSVTIICSALVALSLAVTICAVSFLAILILPDIEDPTQRGIRGLITMLGIFVFCVPPAILYVVFSSFNVSPLISALPIVAVNLGLAVLGSWISGRLYSNFNPSE